MFLKFKHVRVYSGVFKVWGTPPQGAPEQAKGAVQSGKETNKINYQ